MNKKIVQYRIASFLLPVFCLIITGYINNIGIFSDNSVLMWDAEIQYVNFFGYLQDLLHGNSNEVFYSLSITPGEGNALLMGYYLLSPINLLLLLFSKANLPYAFMVIQLIKIGFCGLFMFIFLSKSAKSGTFCNNSFLLALSVCYALNGYVAVYMSNVMWLDGVLILPLMADGIKTIVKSDRYVQYYITLLYALVTNFFIGYMLCFFSATYFVYCILRFGGNDDKRIKSYFKITIKYAFVSLCAVATDAFIALPMAYQLFKGKINNSAGRSRDIKYLFVELILISIVIVVEVLAFNVRKRLEGKFGNRRFFELFTLGLDLLCCACSWKVLQQVANKGYIDKKFFTWPLQMLVGAADREDIFAYELAHLYTGILIFVLFIIYVIDKRADSKKKLLDIVYFTLLIMSLACYDINVMLHGFSYPGGSPHRWIFILQFFVISILPEYFCNAQHWKDVRVKHIDIHFVFLIMVIFLIGIKCYIEYDMRFLHLNYIVFSILIAGGYVLISWLCRKKTTFLFILIPMVCIELSVNVYAVLQDYSFLPYEEFEKYLAVQDTLNSLIEENQNLEGKDHEVYRVESDFHENYYYISGYNSLYHYSSAQTTGNRDFMAKMGYEAEHAYFVPNNFEVDSKYAGLLSVKYLISGSKLYQDDYVELYHDEENGVYLYKNLAYIPMIFCVEGVSKDIEACAPKEEMAEFASKYAEQNIYLKSMPYSHYGCNVSVKSDDSKVVVQIPYDMGWRAKVDGKRVTISRAFDYYINLESLNLGNHSIDLYYVPPYMNTGALISIVSIIMFLIFVIQGNKLSRVKDI